jgi:hypothetical protein
VTGAAFQDSLCEGPEATAQMIGGESGPRFDWLDIFIRDEFSGSLIHYV